MMLAYEIEEALFAMTQKKFQALLEKLPELIEGKNLTRLEQLIEKEGREILRTLLEECIRMQGLGKVEGSVIGKDEIARTHQRVRSKIVTTVFGDVEIDRIIYSYPECESLSPKEATLNLPFNSYSHELAKRVAKEAAKGSFQQAIESIKEYTGVEVPKRQAEEIIIQSARDFRNFYEQNACKIDGEENLELLILSTDGKGIVVRKEDLREQTKKRAEEEKKLKKRLTKGEKKNAKRMAQVASVYNIARHVRNAEEIVSGDKNKAAPKPQGKRVWASIVENQDRVIEDMFNEAVKRDPNGLKEWVILVDGGPHQLKQIQKQLKKRKLNSSIVVDLIHVLEYLWKASYDFYPEGSKQGEEWVNKQLFMVLSGNASRVAAGIKRSATCKNLSKREGVETCARYLCKYAPYLRYQEYLKKGWPIATGIIEGACRHLIKDRMDITGARWSLSGAEAILQLRSICSSGDWEEYWGYHETQEYQRNHTDLYANPEILQPLN